MARNRERKQESVWDYPRPPRVEETDDVVEVWFAGVRIARSENPLRVLETSHPPTYYIPRDDVETQYLARTPRRTLCEFKGQACYYTIEVEDQVAENAVWEYQESRPGYESLAGHLCFYPAAMERCVVDGEVVSAQEGDFYGGWVTSRITGPFKGGPGTRGW